MQAFCLAKRSSIVESIDSWIVNSDFAKYFVNLSKSLHLTRHCVFNCKDEEISLWLF